jgi:hypothetical protein
MTFSALFSGRSLFLMFCKILPARMKSIGLHGYIFVEMEAIVWKF